MQTSKKATAHVVARIISVIVAWIFSMLILLLVGLLVLRLTLSNSDFLKKQIIDSDYLALAEQEIHENYASYGAAGGFSKEFMLQLVSKDDIQNAMLQAVDVLYDPNGKEGKSTFFETVKTAMFENIAQRGIRMTPEIEQGVSQMAQSCADDFIVRTTIPFLPYLQPVILMIQKVTLFAIIGILIAVIVSVWILFSMYKNKIQPLAYLCQSLIASSVLLCIVPVILKQEVPIAQLVLEPKSIKAILVSYIQNTFDSIWPFAIAVTVVTVICCIFYFQKKKKVKYAI